MPPPQQLLSSAVSIVPKKWLNPTFLVLLVFLVVALPLGSPSESTSVRASRKSTKWAHWSVKSEEICPSAKGWVTHPGSFCETLWNSPYLSNRTELEARERRAIQFYCEMDSILDRFDCAQEYSVNVRRGQCHLCREAYREWACAMITDTLEDGQLDCETKLMPCPSCASICHQVMRLCPYLSPDRNQADRKGQITPQTSQYGGHPAFYCPLENDDPSDPAYTSLCFHQSPFSTPDPDYIHNICTNPPIHHHQDPPDLNHHHQNHPLRYNNKPKDSSYYFYSRGKGDRIRTGRHAKNTDPFYSPRSSSSASSVNYFNDRAEYNSGENFNSFSTGGGGGDGNFGHSGSSDAYGDEEEEDDDDWVSAMPHYTSCCWTYASSVVHFHPAQTFPEYGSDRYFMDADFPPPSTTSTTTPTTTTTLSSAHSPRSRNTNSPTPRNNKDSYVNNGSVVDEGRGGGGSTPTSSPTKPSSVSDNRVILNCCDSRGGCNSRDPFDVSQEEEEEEEEEVESPLGVTPSPQRKDEEEGLKTIKTRRSGGDEEVVLLEGPAAPVGGKETEEDEEKTFNNNNNVIIKGQKRSESSSFYFPGEDSSSSSSSVGGEDNGRSGVIVGGGGVQAFDLKGLGGRDSSLKLLGPEEEFFKEESSHDGESSKPTHRPPGEDYDEHYIDTEPDGDGGSSSTELEDDEIFEPPGYSASSSDWGRSGESKGTSSKSSSKPSSSYLSSDTSSSPYSSSSSFFSSSLYSGGGGTSFGHNEDGKSGESSGESKRSFVEIVMGGGGGGGVSSVRGDVDRDHDRRRSEQSTRTSPDIHFVSFDNNEEVNNMRRRTIMSEDESSGGGGGGGKVSSWKEPWGGKVLLHSSSSTSSSSSGSVCSWTRKSTSEMSRQSPPRTLLAKMYYRISTDCCHLFVMLLIALLCLTLTNFLPVFLLNLEDGVGGSYCYGLGAETLDVKSSNFVTTSESSSSAGAFSSTSCSSNSNYRTSHRNEHFERVKKAVVSEEYDSCATCKSDDSSPKYYDDIRGKEVSSLVVVSRRNISRKNIHVEEQQHAYSVSSGRLLSSRDLLTRPSDGRRSSREVVRRTRVLFMFMNAVLRNIMSYLIKPSKGPLARLDLTKRLINYYTYYYYFYSLRNYGNYDRGDSCSKLLANLYCCKLLELLIKHLVSGQLSGGGGQTSLVVLMWGSSQHNYCYYQAVITIRYYKCTTSSVLNCSGCYFYVIPLTPWLSNNCCVTESSRRDGEDLTIQDLNNKGMMSPLSLVGTTNNHNTFNVTRKVRGESCCIPFAFDVYCPVKKVFPTLPFTTPLPTLLSRTSRRHKTFQNCVSQCFPNRADVSYCKRRFRKIQAKMSMGDKCPQYATTRGTRSLDSGALLPCQVIIQPGLVDDFDLGRKTHLQETWERPSHLRGETVKNVSIGSNRCDDFCTVLEKVCSCRGGGELTDEHFPDYFIPWKLQKLCSESEHLFGKSKQSEHFHGQSICGQAEEVNEVEEYLLWRASSLDKVTIPHYSSICSRSAKVEEGERRMCRLNMSAAKDMKVVR